MKKYIYFLIIVLIGLLALYYSYEDHSCPSSLKEDLKQELIARMEKDQEMRNAIIKSTSPEEEEQLWQKAAQIDTENTARMKEILNQYGWPGYQLVGKEGSNAAWLLIQHADQDRDFQRKALEILKVAVEKKDASPENLAYLTDRILSAEGKPQQYGTQANVVDGKIVINPCDNMSLVEKRRKDLGMMTLEEYIKLMESAYIK